MKLRLALLVTLFSAFGCQLIAGISDRSQGSVEGGAQNSTGDGGKGNGVGGSGAGGSGRSGNGGVDSGTAGRDGAAGASDPVKPAGGSGSGGAAGGAGSGGKAASGAGGATPGGGSGSAGANNTPGGAGGCPADSGGAPVVLPNAEACVTTDGWDGVSNEVTMIPGASGVYVFGDGTTTACLQTDTPGKVCLAGIGADAEEDFENYGAAIGVQLATSDIAGNVVAAADLASQMVAGVRFTVDGAAASAAALRVQLTMVDSADIKWSELSFLTDEAGITVDGTRTLYFADFRQPSWADASVQGAALDPSMIHSLQLQFITKRCEISPFDVCISNIEWIDSDEHVVTVTNPPTFFEVFSAGDAGVAN